MYKFISAIVLMILLINDNEYGSFFVEAISFLKSTQILNFSFFLNTTTIGDN
jgi:hypothetical protein